MTITFRIFLALLSISFLHRWLADSSLRTTFLAVNSDLARQTWVGLWGDVWASAILTLPVTMLALLVRKTATIRPFAVFWILIWGALTALHQGYTEFFKTQIIPFHLNYLFDQDFAKANSGTFFTRGPLSVFVWSIFCGVWIWITTAKNAASQTKRQETLQFLAISGVALLCHTANIRWRVQWFVPEPLQTHYLESLYTSLQTKKGPRPLSKAERTLVQNFLIKPASNQIKTIQEALKNRRTHGKSTAVIVLAAESFRPADSGWTRQDSDPPSVTPHFDALAHKGVLFTKAYSSGPVTRGGQEALWCGVPTSTDTSLMRSFPLVQIDCVPDLASRLNVPTLWIHGGEARFDGQESFWRQHKVTKLKLGRDFPEDSSKTDWGISDLTVLQTAATEIQKTTQNLQGGTVAVFVLSVTNHIPWELPSDASEDIKKLEVSHPSQKTTAYFDESLAAFSKKLKDDGVWENSVIIVSSDHGNLEPPRNLSYKSKSNMKYEHLLSHINLLLTGGVVEKLVAQQKLPRTVDETVSQVQVSRSVRDLISSEAKTGQMLGVNPDKFGLENDLFTKSLWPVAADLNQVLFLPESETTVPKELVLDQEVKDLTSPSEAELAALRYRSLIEWLYGMSSKP